MNEFAKEIEKIYKLAQAASQPLSTKISREEVDAVMMEALLRFRATEQAKAASEKKVEEEESSKQVTEWDVL